MFEWLYYGGVHNESLDVLTTQLVSVPQLIHSLLEIFHFILPDFTTNALHTVLQGWVCLSLVTKQNGAYLHFYRNMKRLGEFNILRSG